ncbi:MAG: hypothetical protein M3O31_16345 [Acidobacteriota bacterium]|nr:hypothetical protein [Acidobacteriota bacterium]
MTDDRKSGIALMAGSVGGMLTMAIHPVGSGIHTSEEAAHLALTSGVAHSIAMVSFVLLFLGGVGITRRLAASDRLAVAALVTYGFACVAILIAAAVSGFIVPNIIKMMMRDVPAAETQWRLVIAAVFQFNQAFARIYSVAASVAIGLWSFSALHSRGLKRGTAVYGCIVAPVLIVLIGAGHLRLNVHGMAVVVVAHTIWLVLVGIELLGSAGKLHAIEAEHA